MLLRTRNVNQTWDWKARGNRTKWPCSKAVKSGWVFTVALLFRVRQKALLPLHEHNGSCLVLKPITLRKILKMTRILVQLKKKKKKIVHKNKALNTVLEAMMDVVRRKGATQAQLSYDWGCQRNGNEPRTEGSKHEGQDRVSSRASEGFVSDVSMTQILLQGDRGDAQHKEGAASNTFAYSKFKCSWISGSPPDSKIACGSGKSSCCRDSKQIYRA